MYIKPMKCLCHSYKINSNDNETDIMYNKIYDNTSGELFNARIFIRKVYNIV